MWSIRYWAKIRSRSTTRAKARGIPIPAKAGAPLNCIFESVYYNHPSNFKFGGNVSKMAQILAKISSIREKAAGAMEDVPDTLIGFIVFLLVLTVLGLGILMVMGYLMTR